MLDDKRTFYLDQLKARLQFYRELGIEGVSRRIIASKAKPPGASPAAAISCPDAKTMKENAINPYEEGAKSLSLFEESFNQIVTGDTLEKIREDMGDCQRCKLCSQRTTIVFGSGNPQAQLVFVGEAPGAEEDMQGLPFVGRAGQLLTKILESINLKREDVYICNVIKCRPPNNRFPEKDEIATCSPFLLRQLEVIKPKIICCLGAAAAQTILKTKSSIGWMRARTQDYRGSKVIVTYHPAYLLRNPEAKRDVWEDMKKIKALLEK